MEDRLLEGSISAPEFPTGLEWLNTDTPLTLESLRGKLVLLDFWTFCCINCMHVLPDLKKLEEKYPEELVVIGVHSAKFTNEKETEAIRQAILRYQITHPVLNDKDFIVWSLYAARAWPTLVLINPGGKVIGTHSGEGVFEIFDEIIGRAVDYFNTRDMLKRSPLKLSLERERSASMLLSFPGKVKTDTIGNRLFITDSNHNRILITDPDGRILSVIGSGRQGLNDGTFDTAEFNHPQGTALDGELLYIADTENHTIRAANLSTREVTTVLGTGRQARAYNVSGSGAGVSLNSPWDIVAHDGKLYIAMAGSHQIWVADLKTFEAGPFAGSAREARVDGPHRSAALAQPSGISTDGIRLYFADSETSAVRMADIDPNGKVETIVGEDLFEYGDIDGPRSVARLQHPLGVVYKDSKLYVADTYNSKIKIIDPAMKTSTTLAGTGVPGYADGNLETAQFYEPSGISALGEKLYIADANNHRIRVIDLETQRVTTLQPGNLEILAGRSLDNFHGRRIELPRRKMGAGDGIITLDLILPDGYTLIDGAPLHLDWQSSNENAVSFNGTSERVDRSHLSCQVSLPVTAAVGDCELTFEAVVYFCRTDNASVCMVDNVRISIPVTVQENGTDRIELSFPVQAASI
ncbi:MAG: redoxin domain-containing protein [Candidatus Zixiibacteriota bacterium]|nr:MAG: redoxin domain-containing protein [candidate division Zixibacteria bacterium]